MGKSTVLFCGICLSTLILAVVLETVRLCSCVPRRVTSSEWWLWFTSTTNAPSISLILAQSVLAHMLSITAWHAKLQCVNINELEPSPRVDRASLLHVACIHFHTPRSESSHLTFQSLFDQHVQIVVLQKWFIENPVTFCMIRKGSFLLVDRW